MAKNQGGLYLQPIVMKFTDIPDGVTFIKRDGQHEVVAKVPRMLLIIKVSSLAEGHSMTESLLNMIQFWTELQATPEVIQKYYESGNLLNEMVTRYAGHHKQFFTEGAVEAHFWKE
jgi:hypothetical protein